MVTLFGLLNVVQVLLKVFLGVEGSAVDALQLRILLIPEPVGASYVQQLESFDFASCGDVRPATEIGELAGAIDRNLFIGLGELLDEMALHEVAFLLEFIQTLFSGQKLARIRDVLLHQFLHLLFDLLEIVRSERGWAIEVVKESALGRRTMAELGFGKE